MTSAAAPTRHAGAVDPCSAPPATGLLQTIEAALVEADVAWLRLRPSAPEDPRASAVGDEDVLIDRHDLERAREAARALGSVELPAPGRGGHRFWWAYEQGSGRWTKLDVVTDLCFGPLGALRSTAAAACLERRQRLGAVPLARPDDAFWMLLVHDLFDRQAIPPEHRSWLGRTATAAAAEHPLAALVDPACPPGWDSRRLLDLARAADWTALEAIAPRIGRRWAAARPLDGRLRLAVHRVQRRLASLGFPPRRAMSVALLGPDGAGKSSLLVALGSLPAVPVRPISLRLYGTEVPPGRRGSGLARRILVVWRRYLEARLARARGQLVVFDRHPLEVDRPEQASRRTRWRRWLLGHAIPRPDLVLILDAPAEVLGARRPEHPLAQLARQRTAYLGLAKQLPVAQVIDATAEPEIVLRAVTAAIWHQAAQRGRW